MATAPRRETFIALRARRTAHRVATDVHLTGRSRLIRKQCWNCREYFLTDRAEQLLCEHCRELEQAHWPAPAPPEDPQPLKDPREPVPLRLLIVQWGTVTLMLVFLAYAVIAGVFSDSRQLKESDWAPTVMAQIDHADELRKNHQPAAAIREYEKVREFVDGKKIESPTLRNHLIEMNQSWLEAERELRRASTRP
jgi:hypothetical protein